MNEEQKTASDLISGNVDANSNPSVKEGELPKSDIDLSKYVPKDQYQELEEKIGTQGSELGELRDFFSKMTPLHEILEDNPEIVEAILSKKIDADLAKAVLEGKVKVEDATIVAKANEEVKKEIGTEEYKGLSPEAIEKLITAKVDEQLSKKSKDIDVKLSNAEKSREEKEYKQSVVDFVASVDDYADYSDAINKFIDEHPSQYDIEVIYNAVKGRTLGDKLKTEKDKQQAEEAKNLAANAGAGGSQGGSLSKGKPVIDDYVGRSSDPNY